MKLKIALYQFQIRNLLILNLYAIYQSSWQSSFSFDYCCCICLWRGHVFFHSCLDVPIYSYQHYFVFLYMIYLSSLHLFDIDLDLIEYNLIDSSTIWSCGNMSILYQIFWIILVDLFLWDCEVIYGCFDCEYQIWK